MNQHKLYRTIKSLGEAEFRTEEQLLGHVLENIILNEEIPIRGGRIWKLDAPSGTYRLVRQFGDMEPIEKQFRLRVSEYPMFTQLVKRGTMVMTETNKYLQRKGIRLYSATGIGEKVRWKDHVLYRYVIAINGEFLKEEMTYALNIIGSALSAALKSRSMETKAKALEKDLDKAREIQKSILPQHELRFGPYDMYGVSIPDRIVGGDFFDYLQASDDKDRLSVVVGDAASKGLSAAAQALYVSGALRMGVEYQTKLSTLLARINQLVNRTFTSEHFVSMVIAEFTTSDNGLVFYVNAGHNAPILLRHNSDEVEQLGSTGQIVGPFSNQKYATQYAVMNRGDLLLMYTDGVSEAAGEGGAMYGERRLIEKLRSVRTRPPREICQLIVEDVQIHNRQQEYSDDKTVLVVRRTK